MNIRQERELERQADVVTVVNTNVDDYTFTYQTDDEYYQQQGTGYVDDYNMVRMEVIFNNGYNVDFPVRTKEALINDIKRIQSTEGARIIKIYPSIHSFDIMDYD